MARRARVLLVGDVAVPQIGVTTSVSGDAVRVTLQSSEKLPFRVQQDPGRVTVAVTRDLVDVAHQPERLTGGIVDNVQFVGGKDNAFSIGLGQRFKNLQTFELEAPPRLVLEFQAAPVDAAAAGAVADAAARRRTSKAPASAPSSSTPATAAPTSAREGRAGRWRRT